jgi:DNA-binding transcriptional ArsR family regulator
MAQANDRLRRLVEDELGSCCEADVEDRLAEIERLAAGTPPDVESDLRALKVLGSETRYRIVRMLAAADGELCVCEFEPAIEVSESAISHALSDLTGAGLVARRKEGRWRYYRSTERAERLVAALDATGTGTAVDTDVGGTDS